VQVVDRFHLVHNVRQALEAVLLDHRPALQAAAVCTAMARTPVDDPVPVRPMYRRLSPQPAPPVERPRRDNPQSRSARRTRAPRGCRLVRCPL
jgi:hypothetical protein